MGDMTLYEPHGKMLAEWWYELAPWWWLSFVDPDRPTGSQFLGVVIVQGMSVGGALVEANRLGINPGGLVLSIELRPDHVPPADYRNRLLTRAETESF